jgi:hypothetical protein
MPGLTRAAPRVTAVWCRDLACWIRAVGSDVPPNHDAHNGRPAHCSNGIVPFYRFEWLRVRVRVRETCERSELRHK